VPASSLCICTSCDEQTNLCKIYRYPFIFLLKTFAWLQGGKEYFFAYSRRHIFLLILPTIVIVYHKLSKTLCFLCEVVALLLLLSVFSLLENIWFFQPLFINLVFPLKIDQCLLCLKFLSLKCSVSSNYSTCDYACLFSMDWRLSTRTSTLWYDVSTVMTCNRDLIIFNLITSNVVIVLLFAITHCCSFGELFILKPRSSFYFLTIATWKIDQPIFYLLALKPCTAKPFLDAISLITVFIKCIDFVLLLF
jgi:hypothetical protein